MDAEISRIAQAASFPVPTLRLAELRRPRRHSLSGRRAHSMARTGLGRARCCIASRYAYRAPARNPIVPATDASQVALTERVYCHRADERHGCEQADERLDRALSVRDRPRNGTHPEAAHGKLAASNARDRAADREAHTHQMSDMMTTARRYLAITTMPMTFRRLFSRTSRPSRCSMSIVASS